MDTAVRAGSLAELQAEGRLLTKVGAAARGGPVARGAGLGGGGPLPPPRLPAPPGTVEAGLLTCHWHHARFDLASGCTLDPWADDARGFDVAVEGDDVVVSARAAGEPVERLRRRLQDGLEQGLTLVTAKATLGLLEQPGGADEVVRTALDFGLTNRRDGWGSGLTVLVAMANVLPHLDHDDRALALVHALAFVARDTLGNPPRFPIEALEPSGVPDERLAAWYRRFVDTRSVDAAERTLATAVAAGPGGAAAAEAMQLAAATDHVFIDEGHTLDFTNKAVEALAYAHPEQASTVLTSLVAQTCRADRAEESSEWQHPVDLVGLVERATPLLLAAVDKGAGSTFSDVGTLGWALLEDDPEAVVEAILGAAAAGATPEQLGRAVAFAAALRITRFHVQNDHGDWDTVHHSFTTANGLHQALVPPGVARAAAGRAARGPARLPRPLPEHPGGAAARGRRRRHRRARRGVGRPGRRRPGRRHRGGLPARRRLARCRVIAALGRGLLHEDAGFHWFQVYEAGVRQSLAWPEGSPESALVLAGVARWLAAHTPTRRELPTVVRIATRLRRGDPLYEEA